MPALSGCHAARLLLNIITTHRHSAASCKLTGPSQRTAQHVRTKPHSAPRLCLTCTKASRWASAASSSARAVGKSSLSRATSLSRLCTSEGQHKKEKGRRGQYIVCGDVLGIVTVLTAGLETAGLEVGSQGKTSLLATSTHAPTRHLPATPAHPGRNAAAKAEAHSLTCQLLRVLALPLPPPDHFGTLQVLPGKLQVVFAALTLLTTCVGGVGQWVVVDPELRG
jgi:hypothetical protein